MNSRILELSIDRTLFRKRFAEALLASSQMKMPMILLYDTNDGSFDFSNTRSVSRELVPIIEVNANRVDHNLPLDDPNAIDNMLKKSEEKILKQVLPELIERLSPNTAR
ncbi:hypothetical protein AGMMS49521_0900 [Campylobacterota bacterium]|nr:hypothetical protein AGMMS49521_0900 [Campylobacterota bacterium]GHV06342.1 hypothetical protein AGMMS50229_10960 [Campylobacterota bacterium]